MPKSRKVTVKKSAKIDRLRRTPASPLAVLEPRLRAPAASRVKQRASRVAKATTSPSKPAAHVVDLMLAWSPLGMLLRQQAAFASMLSATTRNEAVGKQPQVKRRAVSKRSRVKA